MQAPAIENRNNEHMTGTKHASILVFWWVSAGQRGCESRQLLHSFQTCNSN
jgi:hypothetical protein